MSVQLNHYLKPAWPALPTVKAVSTYRFHGKSLAPFEAFNLGHGVGDTPEVVKYNREQLQAELQLSASPVWLNQTHRLDAIELTSNHPIGTAQSFDASFTSKSNTVCAVLTADCLPILVCDKKATLVCAIHAGWRGLAHGIIEKTIQQLPAKPTELMAWLGPAISQRHFEVGGEVKALFAAHPSSPASAFMPGKKDKWFLDLYQLAKARLAHLGVVDCFGGDRCTYAEKDHFFSYRRDGTTGRQATLIWLAP